MAPADLVSCGGRPPSLPAGVSPDQPASRAANAAIPAAPQCQDGSARSRRPVVRPALVPERSLPVVACLAAEPGERRPRGRAVGGRVDVRAGQVLEHPADPRGSAVQSDVLRRPGIAGQLLPDAAVDGDAPQPASGLSRAHAVGGVAGDTGGLQVHPRDACDSELEARGRPGTRLSGERPADRSRRILRPPGRRPTRAAGVPSRGRPDPDRAGSARGTCTRLPPSRTETRSRASRARRSCVAAGASRRRSMPAAARRPRVHTP